MAKICYGKWSYWIPRVGVLLGLFAVITAQPPGFLSIRCGGKTNYTDENNIKWVTDTDYIDVGETADIGNVTTYGSPLDSLRYFPKPLNKSCYQLPVPSKVPYLLRLWFLLGNYTRFQQLPSFSFSIETGDMLAVENITALQTGLYSEKILATSGTVMYVCLIRTSDNDDPFISGIELRPLQDGMYAQAKPGTLLHLITRIDAGGNPSTVLRYPQDNFDRIWTSDIDISINEKNVFQPVSSGEPISTNNTEDLPPTAVMQTALVANSSDGVYFTLGSSQVSKSLLLLYFAEIETLNMSESRSFNVTVYGETVSKTITLVRNYSAVELTFVSNESDYFTLSKTANSTLRPIINAFEYYWLIDTQPPTYSQDIEALDAIKRSFDIKDWISDPCYLIDWKGIGCDNSSSVIRISEINLSRQNLTGPLPKDIEQLTALVSVSLNNNYLMGPLPNFSTLTMLERLYLQNNNLNGTVPEWLSQLKNLKELNIENNNFSGVIPAQLLINCSLQFK